MYLSWLIALLPMSVILLIVGIRKLGALQEKQWRQGVEGVLMIGAWLVVIYFLTGKLEIPREFPPPDYNMPGDPVLCGWNPGILCG